MIIATKLEIPRIRTRLIARTRLLGRLEAGRLGKMTLIAAPAGYGKTTLTVQWLRQQRPEDSLSSRPLPQPAWLTLEAEDNDSARFFVYLIAALQRIDIRIGREAQEALSTLQPPEPQAVMIHLINDIARLSSEIVLILDDYHMITEPAVHEVLAFLVDQMPGNLHLILLTRSTPPLSLARLRAQEQLMELDMDDLRLTPEEIATFLHDVMALSLSNDVVQKLGIHTEGWLAGLQMAALSLHGRTNLDEFVANFSAGHRFIADFFNEEVLQRETESIQRFLLRTSILERLCPALAETVLFGNDAATIPSFSRHILREIEQRNLFLLPLDDERNWYRYHKLFLDLLRKQAKEQLAETEVVELHRRAARWYQDHDCTGDAIHHLLEAGDAEEASMLIESVCEQYRHGDFGLLRGWLARLPETTVESRLRLALFSVIVLLADDRTQEAAARLDVAERLLESTQSYAEGPGILAALRGRLAFNQAQISEAIDQTQLALSLVPESSTIWRTEIRLQLASAYWVFGDPEGAEHQYREIHFTNRVAGDERVVLLATWKIGGLHHAMGELHQAQAYYKKVLERAGQPGLGVVCACAARSLGQIYREWNRLQEASATFQRGLTLSQAEDRNKPWRAYTRLSLYASLALTVHHQGHAARAREFLTTAEEIALKANLPEDEYVELLEIYRIYFAIAEGKTEVVSRWLTSNGPAETDIGTIMLMTEQYKSLCHAWVRGLLALGAERARDVVSIARRLDTIFAGGGHERDAIYMRLATTCAHHLMREDEQALALLLPILKLGKREGLVRTFIDFGAPMATLLKQVMAQGVLAEYAALLLSALSTDPWLGQGSGTDGARSGFGADSALAEPLTPREQQILALMAAGLSNAEIAGELVISVATVKRHITNLYGKLGVRRRAEALSRAWEWNLVSA